MNNTIVPDRELDIRAEFCPMTFVRTRLALDRLSPGQVLRTVINRAMMSKWGFRVGEVLLSFTRTGG